MNAFKQQCIELRKKDHSLSEIVAMTGRSKTSVYFHIKDMPLSAKRKHVARMKHAAHLRKFSEQRKGKSTRSFRTFDTWDIPTVSLVAHLMFDGEVSKSGCMYNNRNEALIQHVRKNMLQIYEYEPRRYINETTGVKRISYHNVALAAYVSQKSDQLLDEIIDLSISLQREFLRAFFDDEGCMDFRGSSRRCVRGYQKDTLILRLVQHLLTNLGIESKVRLPNEVAIVGKENLMQFRKEINFSRGVQINGNRSSSLWKKSLQKRDILDRAIASFKT